MPRLKAREGFALPMAILVIALLTAILAAGFAATAAEIGSNLAQRGQSTAYAIAQGGLEQFLVQRNQAGFCTAPNHCIASRELPVVNDSDYAVIALQGGYAEVVARQLRAQVDDSTPAVYFITSRGVDTTHKLGGAARGTVAERTVGTLAYYSSNIINVISGWTSLSGVSVNGASARISGVDGCPASTGGGKPPVAGVAVPTTPGYTQNGGDSTRVLSGSPTATALGSQAAANASVKIDWDGIVNHGAITPDVVIPSDPWPSFSDPNYWPVIMIKNYGGSAYSLPNAGRGTLIVTGDLIISGSDMWQGVILIGGTLTSNGNNTVAGATISGLNEKLGIDVPVNSVGNGTKSFTYNSCNVARAGQGMRAYFAMPNVWMDDIAAW